MKKALFFLAALFLSFLAACSNGGDETDVEEENNEPVASYDYTPAVNPVVSEEIDASAGGVVEVTTADSSIRGAKLTIPANALMSDKTITIGEVINPPELPLGLNFVGTPIDLGPDGSTFMMPLKIEIPYSDEELSDAGVSDDVALKLYSYNKTLKTWVQEKIVSIDTTNNVVTGEVTHFSYYAMLGMSGTPPVDLGTPQPGDLLYKLGNLLRRPATSWSPGHVGIYTGEKTYPGVGLASDTVKSLDVYNVIEALGNGVQYSYYDIPNITESFEGTGSLPKFNGDDVYMGAREPIPAALTAHQRESIVSYAEGQIGKPYAKAETALGLLGGPFVKGPSSFNCVGLAEKAYENANVNAGEGLVTAMNEIGLLTPPEQYNNTKPAGGINPSPTIEEATLTPNSGTECTQVITEVSVSHTYGLSYIDSVAYVTDDGYTNPALSFNDNGVRGDSVAGDGTYTLRADVGGRASWGEDVFIMTVTDKYGATDSENLVFTYTGTCRTDGGAH